MNVKELLILALNHSLMVLQLRCHGRVVEVLKKLSNTGFLGLGDTSKGIGS